MEKIARAPVLAMLFLCGPARALTSTHYDVAPLRVNLVLGADGNIWYATFGGVGRITPSGQAQSFIVNSNLEFDDIAVGADGNLWSVSRYDGTLYAFTTSGTAAHDFPLSSDMGYGVMATATDGRLWLSTFPGNADTLITAVDTAGHATVYSTPTAVYGITAGPDGNLWAVGDTKILRIANSGSAMAFDMPLEGSAQTIGGTIVSGADGKLWISTNILGCPFSPCIYLGAALASVDVNGATAIYPSPDADLGSAVGVAFGGDGNPWLLEFRFNPATTNYEGALLRKMPNGNFTAFPFHGSPGAIVTDASGNLWIGDSFGTQITKVVIPPDLVFSDGLETL